MNDIEKYQEQELTSDLDHPEVVVDSHDGSLLRLWYVVLGVFILIFPISAFLVWKIFVPTYTTIGYISVEPVLINPISGEQDKGEISNYESYLNAQAYEMKNNSSILEKVVEDLRDKDLLVFNPENLRNEIQQALNDETLMVSVPRGNQVVQVSMTSTRTRDAELVVSAFLNAYMAVEGEKSGQSENQNITLLENESEGLEASYQTQQENLNKLAADYGADSLEGLLNMMYGEQTRLQEKIAGLESRLLDLQVSKSVLSAIPDPNVFPLEMLEQRDGAINSDPYVLSTTNALVGLKQELLVKEQQLSKNSPELANIQKLIDLSQVDLDKYREEAGKNLKGILKLYKNGYIRKIKQNLTYGLPKIRC